MSLPESFRSYLSKSGISSITVKNYASDINKFLFWFRDSFKTDFSPKHFTNDVISLFIKTKGGLITYEDDANGLSSLDFLQKEVSDRSFERYLSTLRKFSDFLLEEKLIASNPFHEINKIQPRIEAKDPWFLKEFKNYLYSKRASHLTIKNYVLDINAFSTWFETVEKPPHNIDQYIRIVQPSHIEDYKERLINILGLSPKTVNRKLSSIRKYFDFAKEKGLMDSDFIVSENTSYSEFVSSANLEEKETIRLDEIKEDETNLTHSNRKNKYSVLPPVRLAQKLFYPYEILETILAAKLAPLLFSQKALPAAVKIAAKVSTKTIASVENTTGVASSFITSGSNTKSDFYAPSANSISNLGLHEKVIHHLRFSRPKWYKRYHNYAFVHYIHFAILIIYASALGAIIYNGLFIEGEQSKALAVAPPSTLSFQGRLTDSDGNPITEATNIRFLIYSDASATDSGYLLWQEVDHVKPDESGVFSQLLGNSTQCVGGPLAIQESPCGIPSSLFSSNQNLYLGIAVEDTAELAPRQQLATVAFAANSNTIQGMLPITDPDATTANVILALDSTGNLTIGNNANPTFQATGGQFTLSGTTLLLTTNVGSNSNIQFIPDGTGSIDFEKAVVNNSNFGAISPGSFEIHDKTAILATESAVAAFMVNNNTTGGDIFVASSSGTTRFQVQNNGNIGLQPGLSIDTLSTGSISIGNNTATNLSLGRAGQSITLPAYSSAGGILFSNNGTLAMSGTGTSTQCLLGGSTPSFGSCTGNLVTHWNQSQGVLSPHNSTLDFTIGGQATSSARFAILNVNGGGPVTATISGNLIVMPQNGAAGNVGIGTNAPEVNLHVNSTADGTVLRLQDADGTCDHDPEAGLEIVSCSSDERLKKDITDAKDILPDLLKLRIRDYTVISSGNKITGVIAQEVKEVFPSMVHEGANGFYTVEQPSPWLLLKGIQELAIENSKMKKVLGGLDLSIEDLQNISIKPQTDPEGNVIRNGYYTVEDIFGEPIKQVGTFASAVIGNLRVGAVEAQEIATNKLAVATDSVTIAGQSLNDYIIYVVHAAVENGQIALGSSAIVSPVASIDKLSTNTISPLAGTEVKINADLKIKGNATVSGSLVAANLDTNQLQVNSDATISGTLTADNANINGNLSASSSSFLSANIQDLNSNNATISGTLYADRIKAGSIDGLEDKIAHLTSQYANNQSSNASSSANTNSQNDLIASLTGTEQFISHDGFLDITNVSADFGTFREGLVGLGPATFNQVTALDGLSVGTTLNIGPNSIDSLGTDLEIQPLRQGGVSFLAGLVRIDSDGTLKVAGDSEFAGDVSVQGKLSAGVLSPLPNNKLVIARNGSDEAISSSSASLNDNLVDIRGSLTASGSGTFNKLNLSFAPQAYALSDTEIAATGSAGTAAIKRYRTEVTIYNPQVNERSLIYITPVGNTNNKIPYLLRQVAGASFTVGVGSTNPSETNFNWIIVN